MDELETPRSQRQTVTLLLTDSPRLRLGAEGDSEPIDSQPAGRTLASDRPNH